MAEIQRVSFEIPAALHERIRKTAQEHGLNMTAIWRMSIDDFLTEKVRTVEEQVTDFVEVIDQFKAVHIQTLASQKLLAREKAILRKSALQIMKVRAVNEQEAKDKEAAKRK